MRSGNSPVSTGTAFLVRSPVGHLLITSRQNVTGQNAGVGVSVDKRRGPVPDRIVIWHHVAVGDRSAPRWRAVVQPLHDRNGNALWIEHPALGSRADVVAIRLLERALGTLEPLSLHPYNLSRTNEPLGFAPADKVSVVGFPLDIKVAGFNPVWSAAYVASEPEVDVDNLPVVLIDCRTNTGHSGSPVIATNGFDPALRLLGLYGGRVGADADIGRVWKASAIVELIDSVSPFYGDMLLNGNIAQSPDWLDFAGYPDAEGVADEL